MTSLPRCGRLSVRQHGSVNSWAGGPMSDMRQRAFITLLGGAAAAWPFVAQAQQVALPVIGFMSSTSAAPFANLVTAFRDSLKATGFVEGQNVAIEFR